MLKCTDRHGETWEIYQNVAGEWCLKVKGPGGKTLEKSPQQRYKSKGDVIRAAKEMGMTCKPKLVRTQTNQPPASPISFSP